MPVDLSAAIQKHAEWKFKFRNALNSHEAMDVAVISKDNKCEVGKWLHGEASALYAKTGSLSKCIVNHAAFHAEAGRVAAAVNAKKVDEVGQMLSPGSSFSEISRKLGVSLVELKNEIGQ
jgi:methyl-accepting chemotaxis protein